MNEIYPISNTDWGNINSRIAESTDSSVTLNLSNFINTLTYYEIQITNNIDFFYIIGNKEVSFYATVKALERVPSITLEIKDLNLHTDKAIPIFDIAKNNEDNIFIFEDNNILVNSSTSEITNNSGIFVQYNTKLIIEGKSSNMYNTLNVTGGVYGAGIGSANNIHAGTIIFRGNYGTIYSIGGDGSSGIGGGLGGNGGTIKINDSVIIYSKGGYYGCGIGGGFHYNFPGNSGVITIKDNSKVFAYGGVGGCGIGGGACFYNNGADLESLEIIGYSIVYSYGNYVAAGIGGGFGLGGFGGNVNYIRIAEYSTVYGYGGNLGCGIGGGYGSFGGNTEFIIMSNYSTANVYGGLTAGGISGGTAGAINTKGGNLEIIIIENNVIVNSFAGIYGAGIGGGSGDLGGNGGVITLLDSCSVTSSNFVGYYNNSLGVSELNICGGELNTPNLHLSEMNLINPDICGGGGYIIINNNAFTPQLLKNNFLKVKLIYPNGNPYTNELYLNNINPNVSKILVYPTNDGYLTFYASDGTYYFSTPPISTIYKTETFSVPHNYGATITLIVPVYAVTRGINIFKD